MFEQLCQETRMNINTVRAMIQTNEKFRNIIFTEDAIREKLESNSEFYNLVKVTPNETDWKIYDHCATVTRLYAIYERFFEDIISDWLLTLPELVSQYSDLEEKIQIAHREGIGRLLLDLKKNRFQHLSAEKVLQGLFSGVTNNEQYELLPDAFLNYEQNLRKDQLEKIFNNVGIENTWKWIKNHRKIKYFVEEIAGGQSTAEAELRQLVDYRNEAAHGAVGIDQILGTQELLDLTDFVTALCEALVELVNYKIICRKELIEKVRKIGQITEWFQKPQAAVAKLTDITLCVEESVWLVSEQSSYCQLVKIESIKLHNTYKSKITVDSETEVGLKFDTDAKEGLSVYAKK